MAPPKAVPLLPPQRRIDDPSIPGALIVWRELDPAEAPIDPNTGERKIMSAVFRTEEMSVRLSDRISMAQVIANAPGAYLAELRAKDLRDENCIIARDPNDPAHGLVYDQSQPGERAIPQKAARRIRKRAILIIP